MLGSLCDSADGRFKVEFSSVNVDFLSGMHRAKSRYWVGGIGDTKLAAKCGRGYPMVMLRDVQNLRIGDRAQQLAHKTVELRIGDEMSRLLLAK